MHELLGTCLTSPELLLLLAPTNLEGEHGVCAGVGLLATGDEKDGGMEAEGQVAGRGRRRRKLVLKRPA
jgi:hypothetical protein